MREDQKNKKYVIIINIVRALLLFAIFGAFVNERWLVFSTALIAFLITFLPMILEKKWGVKIPAEFEVMILLFIYGSLFFGEVRGFYARFWWWGILLNLVSALALGLIGLTILYVLYKDEKINASPVMIAVFTFCFALASGTAWEIFEFSVDKIFGFNLQSSAIEDTMTNLIVNAAGSLLVAIGGYFYIKQGKKNIFSRIILSFIEKNPLLIKSRKEKPSSKLMKLIKRGESEKLEFKSTLRINIHTGEIDKGLEHSALKTIVAFLNSEGGTLLVGVSDKGEITGIEKDGFNSNDKLTLHFTNLLKQKIGSEYLPFINFDLIKLKKKHVLKVVCGKSDKQVFLKRDGEEEFYVRNGPSSVRISGSALVDYIKHKFKSQ